MIQGMKDTRIKNIPGILAIKKVKIKI